MTETYAPPTSASAESRAHRPFPQRLLAAMQLESALYEEVEHDPDALPQATAVVALAAGASAIASLAVVGAAALLSGVVAAFVSWLVWTAIVWLVGVKVFEHDSDFEELLRTFGFVAAPQLLYVLAVIPLALWQALVGFTVIAMTLVGFVRATRQALDVDTGRALLVAGLGVLVYLVLGAAVGAVASFG